ncbi:hypothetical protein LVJ94_35280 [Pendulispora rubella]|uniref:DUF3892 domain-containing protein n=1 Tax=Pendulispora rubella TaxID=2741070 RepID=A0ABZ2KTZ3_9BACT
MFSQVRNVGVGIPAGQRSEPGTSRNTVHAVAEAKHYAVVYDDDEGKRHYNIAVQVGDDLYLHPTGEAWTAALRQLKPDTWLARQITQKIIGPRAESAQVPDVDVFGGETKT